MDRLLGGAVVRLAILAALMFIAGCGDRDAVMGRTAGTPVPEPQKVHCDLIFPGTDRR